MFSTPITRPITERAAGWPSARRPPYFTIGDDGYGPNAQLRTTTSARSLRIDPADPDGNGPASHTVPPTTHFVAEAGTVPEIYAYGLRNPFRASFCSRREAGGR